MQNSYALAAINAAKDAQLIGNPVTAWENTTIDIFGKGTSQQLKGCPKNAFLGLCEAGIKGIPKGKYTTSRKNKAYALKAVEFFLQNPTLSAPKLWSMILLALKEDPHKQHNEQMSIVIALCKKQPGKYVTDG